MTNISLGNYIEIDKESAIGYEITFAALLATALLFVPNVSTPLYPVAIGSAFLLLTTTLVRRMSFLNPYSKDLLRSTTPLLVISTAFGLLYLTLVLGSFTQPYIPFVNPRPSTLGLLYAVAFCLGFVLLYEALFRDFFLLICIFAYNQHLEHQGTILGRIALTISKKSLSSSLLPKSEWPKEVRKIQTVDSQSSPNVSVRIRILHLIGTLLAILGIVLIFSLPLVVFYLLMSMVASPNVTSIIIDGGLLAIAVNYLIVSLRFLYGRYGQTPFTEIASPKRYMYYSLILYALYFIHVAYEQGLFLS
ncbi:hypothetical protein [Natronosalvus amylolyticus]|uniref:hypothetical protein n=1 Tax=Natronosalvus amylolyticus TaxID=2961994 RepID=UPI0020C9A9D2|nr:hypothetical protein [Natronosalvus amylolyticus]